MLSEKKISKQNKIFELLILLLVITSYTIPLYFYGVESTEDYSHTNFFLKLSSENFFNPFFFYFDLLGPGSRLSLGTGLDYFYIPSLFIGNLSLFYFFSIIFCFYIQFNYLKKLLKLFNCKFFYLLFVLYSFNITYLNQLLINDSIKTLFSLSFFPLIFYYFLKFIRSEKAHYFFKFLLAFSYFFLNSHPTINLMIIIAFLFFLIMNKSFFIFKKKYTYFGLLLFLILISDYSYKIIYDFPKYEEALRQQLFDIKFKHFSSGIVFVFKFFEDFFNFDFPFLSKTDVIDNKMLPFGGLLFYFAFFYSIKEIFSNNSNRIYFINYLFLLSIVVILLDTSKYTSSIINNNHTYRDLMNFLSVILLGLFLTKIKNKKVLHSVILISLVSTILHYSSTLFMQANQKKLTYNQLKINEDYKNFAFYEFSKNITFSEKEPAKTYISQKIWNSIKDKNVLDENYKIKKIFLEGNIFHFRDFLNYKIFPFNGEFKNSSKYQLRNSEYKFYSFIDPKLSEINDNFFFNLFNIQYLIVMRSELNEIDKSRFKKKASIKLENDEIILYELNNKDKIVLNKKNIFVSDCKKSPKIHCLLNSDLGLKRTQNLKITRAGLNKYKILNNSPETKNYILPFLYDTGWKSEFGVINNIEKSLMFLEIKPNSTVHIYYEDNLRFALRLVSIFCFFILISTVINYKIKQKIKRKN